MEEYGSEGQSKLVFEQEAAIPVLALASLDVFSIIEFPSITHDTYKMNEFFTPNLGNCSPPSSGR